MKTLKKKTVKKKKPVVEQTEEATRKVKKTSTKPKVEKVQRIGEDTTTSAAPKNHNNPPEEIEPEKVETKGRDSGGIEGMQLLQFINRVERLEEEKKSLSEDIKDIFLHAKSTGFDVKIMRKVIAMRKRDKSDVEEEMSLIDTYRHAIGDI